MRATTAPVDVLARQLDPQAAGKRLIFLEVAGFRDFDGGRRPGS